MGYGGLVGKFLFCGWKKNKLSHVVKIDNNDIMFLFKKNKGSEYTVYKALPNSNSKQFVILCHDRDLDTESKALFCSDSYRVIFGQTKKRSNQQRQRLSVVKIKCGKRKIYRSFQARSITGLNKDSIGLSPNACQELGIEPNGEIVTVTKGCIWGYFWKHPNSATRISFQIGLIGLFMAVLGMFISLI